MNEDRLLTWEEIERIQWINTYGNRTTGWHYGVRRFVEENPDVDWNRMEKEPESEYTRSVVSELMKATGGPRVLKRFEDIVPNLDWDSLMREPESEYARAVVHKVSTTYEEARARGNSNPQAVDFAKLGFYASDLPQGF